MLSHSHMIADNTTHSHMALQVLMATYCMVHGNGSTHGFEEGDSSRFEEGDKSDMKGGGRQ